MQDTLGDPPGPGLQQPGPIEIEQERGDSSLHLVNRGQYTTRRDEEHPSVLIDECVPFSEQDMATVLAAFQRRHFQPRMPGMQTLAHSGAGALFDGFRMSQPSPIETWPRGESPHPTKSEKQAILEAHQRSAERDYHLTTIHEEIAQSVLDDVHQFRQQLLVPACWIIHVRVCCPHEMPAHEATIEWHVDHWQAVLSVRCDLSSELRHWDTAHELGELLRQRSTDLFFEVMRILTTVAGTNKTQLAFLEMAHRQYRQAVNQEIEARLTVFLGATRPTSISM